VSKRAAGGLAVTDLGSVLSRPTGFPWITVRHSSLVSSFVLAGMLIVFSCLALGYAAGTPAWNNPDEPAHYMYIAQIAETATLPVLQPQDWTPDRLTLLIQSHFPAGSDISSLRYEAWQPPLYYLLAAPMYRLSPADPPFARLQALHAFNILLGVATLVLSYAISREVFVRVPASSALESSSAWGRTRWLTVASTPNEGVWLALAMPGVLIGVPMLASTSAAINNDNLANVLGALLTLLLIRTVVAPDGSSAAAARLGAVLGLGVLTKLTLGVFLPIALLAIAVRAVRHRQRRDEPIYEAVVLLAIMLLVLSPWLVRQGLTYGWDDLLAKGRHDAVMTGQHGFSSFTLSDPLSWLRFLRVWTETLFRSSWALFGWVQITAPGELYVLWKALTLVAVVGAAVNFARQLATGHTQGWHTVDPRPALLGVVVMGTLLTIVYYNVTTDIQPQGRFVFVAAAAIGTLFVLGWATVLPSRARLPGLSILILTLLALNVYTLEHVLRPAYGA
jgi:hypothetical protein